MKYELILGCKHYPFAVLCYNYSDNENKFTILVTDHDAMHFLKVLELVEKDTECTSRELGMLHVCDLLESQLDHPKVLLTYDKLLYNIVCSGLLTQYEKDMYLKKLWELFGNVPIDDDENIDIDFADWEKGTYRMDIWHWFDEEHSKGVAWLSGIGKEDS
jgi:hypothetical protein